MRRRENEQKWKALWAQARLVEVSVRADAIAVEARRVSTAIIGAVAGILAGPVLLFLIFGLDPLEPVAESWGIPNDESGVLITIVLGAAIGAQVGVMAGWFSWDFKDLHPRYLAVLVWTLVAAVLVTIGIWKLPTILEADQRSAGDYLAASCLPLGIATHAATISLVRSVVRAQQRPSKA